MGGVAAACAFGLWASAPAQAQEGGGGLTAPRPPGAGRADAAPSAERETPRADGRAPRAPRERQARGASSTSPRPAPAAEPAPDAAPRADCVPACREGYVCDGRGRCVEACNPPCGPGMRCTAEASCVSACDPPCGAGQRCSGAGRCVEAQPRPPPSFLPPSSAPPAPDYQRPAPARRPPPAPEPDRRISDGWGTGAAVWGLLNLPLLGGLTAGAALTHDSGVALGLGLTVVVYSVVFTPIVGGGAGSPRGVRSSAGALVTGWIFYALSIAAGASLIGVAAVGGGVPAIALFGPLGGIGLANLFFAGAGFSEAARARRALRARETSPGWSLRPVPLRGPEGRLRGAALSARAHF